MEQDYDGTDVLDNEGSKVGRVERTYVDDNGTARLVKVKMGAILGEHRLVPVDDASLTDEGLTLTYSKKMIEGSPDHSSAGDVVDHETLDRVRSYYSGQTEGQSMQATAPDMSSEEIAARPRASLNETESPTSESLESRSPAAARSETRDQSDATQFGQMRDLGDVIEIPIVEERLVKQRVVKEVLRVRKSDISETRSVEGTVRKESLDVDKTGEASVRDDGVNRSV